MLCKRSPALRGADYLFVVGYSKFCRLIIRTITALVALRFLKFGSSSVKLKYLGVSAWRQLNMSYYRNG